MYSLNTLNSDENGFFIYSDKYKIKELFLERIKFNKNININSLDDISNLQIAFGNNIPIENTSAVLLYGNNKLTMEFIIQRILIDKMGGDFIMCNLLFGTFLKELGINIKLIKPINYEEALSSMFENPLLRYYMTNVIEINGNSYLVDVGLGKLSPYKPIKLTSLIYTSNDQISNLDFRIRKSTNDTNFIYEYFINKKNNLNNTIFHFTLSPINIDLILSNYDKYLTSGYISKTLFKLFNGGYFNLSKNDLIIKLKNTDLNNHQPQSSIKLQIKDQDHYNQIVNSLFYNNITSKM